MIGVVKGEVDDVFEARFSTRGSDRGFKVVGFRMVAIVGGVVGAVGLGKMDHSGGGGGGNDGAEEQ